MTSNGNYSGIIQELFRIIQELFRNYSSQSVGLQKENIIAFQNLSELFDNTAYLLSEKEAFVNSEDIE